MADRFDIFHTARTESEVLEDIWQKGFDQDYAADAKPNGFYPSSVLDRIIAVGSNTSGRTLFDVGCGYGWTGLFLAERMNMKLLGTDASPIGIELAKKEAAKRGITAEFWVADASSSGLEDGACAIVTCLDVLLYLPDKPTFLKEMHRILESGGFFIFTTWEQHGYSERLRAQQIDDYRPLLRHAGFEIQCYEEIDGAREQQSRIFDGLLSREAEVGSEVGDLPATMFAGMAKSARQEASGRKYVFGIARRGQT